MGTAIVGSDDTALLKAVIAVLVKKCGGEVTVTQLDMDAISGMMLVDRFDFDRDASVLAVVGRTDPRVPPGFGSVQ